jgi:hypothetical protein
MYKVTFNEITSPEICHTLLLEQNLTPDQLIFEIAQYLDITIEVVKLKYQIVKVKKVPSCYGCREGIANQEAHIGPTGCLGD